MFPGYQSRQCQQMRPQQEGGRWLPPQSQPAPAQQAVPSYSPQLYSPSAFTMGQAGLYQTALSAPSSGALGWSGSTLPHPHPPAQYQGYSNLPPPPPHDKYQGSSLPAYSLGRMVSQQGAPTKRSADGLTEAEMATAKRLALEKDCLAQIEIARRQEQARFEEKRRKAARLAAAAEKQHREIFQRMEAMERQRREAAEEEAAAALERQRRAQRKAELKTDSDRNFHSYLECLEYWPLAKGEYQSPYMKSLLANQRVPTFAETDSAIAIKYAKKHWYLYRLYPQDIALTIEEAKAEEMKEKKKALQSAVVGTA
ncbi:hypothetical protein IAQ61_000760 [Plenodomus lingam]|uniref:uncharacterized protein n=1 Tax=Leptosphaeria maculans TaxID=5022 RepID=UPI003316DB00|nr:hypothetical protein IAQ61_000760 [Plenodomus lingam]